jgi:putative FmdB family regulatory protein
MPIYEYVCGACNGRFQKLVGLNSSTIIACPRCASQNVQKVVSRFAVIQSEEARLESLADPSTLGGLDMNDPASVARWAKNMGKQLGEEAGDDWDETVDQMLEEELSGERESGASGQQDDLGWA